MEIIEKIIFFTEVVGSVFFAFSGALTAIEKGLDIFGVIVLGVTTAVGGGILRDLLLGISPPSMFLDHTCVLTALVASVILFVVIKILLLILSKIFEKITQSKIVGSVDKLLGFVLGAVKGALGIFVLFGVVYLLSPVITPLGDLVISLSETNPIAYQIYLWSTELLDKVFIPWFSCC